MTSIATLHFSFVILCSIVLAGGAWELWETGIELGVVEFKIPGVILGFLSLGLFVTGLIGMN